MRFVTCVSPRTLSCKGNRKSFEKTLRHLFYLLKGPFCLWDSGTARIMNSETSKKHFVSAFHLLISFILLAGFFHLGHKHCHHTWQKLLQEGTCLVSHGKLKQTNKKLYSSNWPSQSQDPWPITQGQRDKVCCMCFSEYQHFFQKQGNYCDLDNHPTLVYYRIVMALEISSKHCHLNRILFCLKFCRS